MREDSPSVVGVAVVLGNSLDLLVNVGCGFLFPPLLLAPKRTRSRGLPMSVDVAYPSPIYTVWRESRDGSENPETERAILNSTCVWGLSKGYI